MKPSPRLVRGIALVLVPLALAVVDRTPAGATPFVNVTTETNVTVFANSLFGAGVAFLDYDGDSDLDIHVVDGEGDPNVLFRNNGNRTFTEVGATVGLNQTPWGKAVVPTDFDNDGDPDMLLTTYGATEINRLLRNDGGVYTDITSGSGFDFAAPCTGAAWGDYDGDGLLDCYITVYDTNRPNRLLHNLGGGIFVDVAASLGVQDMTGWGYQPAWLDYDGDADADLYVANDDFFGGTANKLYRNNGNGTFTDVSVASGAGVLISAMGLAIGDYDSDLDPDIYVTNLPEGNVLLRNDNGSFVNVGASLGVAVNFICWGADFFDYDHDGWLDLYVAASDENGNPHDFAPEDPSGHPRALRGGGGAPNRLFRGQGAAGFTDVSAASGADDAGVSYGTAVGDYDADGDLDLYVTNLWFTVGDASCSFYENTIVPRGNTSQNWLRVRLIGTTSNRDAVGAQVWIQTPGHWQMRERQAGTSYLCASDPTIHFGLAGATTVSRLFVRWPSGLVESYANVPGGQTITLIEGEGATSSVPNGELAGGAWALLGAAPNPATGPVRLIVQAEQAGAARLEVFDAMGRRQRSLPLVSSGAGARILSWDSTDDRGVSLPAGSYFVRLMSGDRVFGERRIVLLQNGGNATAAR